MILQSNIFSDWHLCQIVPGFWFFEILPQAENEV